MIHFDGTGGHLGIFGGLGGLCDGDAAFSADGHQAEGAVGIGPRQDDPNGIAFLIGAKGAEKGIDGVVGVFPVLAELDAEEAPFNPGHLSGRQDIDMVRLRPEALLNALHAHGRASGQDFDKVAGLVGSQMGDEDEGHPGVVRQGPQQFSERGQPTGRGADADHRIGQGFRLVLFI